MCGKHVSKCLLPCDCAKYNLWDRNVRSWVNWLVVVWKCPDAVLAVPPRYLGKDIFGSLLITAVLRETRHMLEQQPVSRETHHVTASVLHGNCIFCKIKFSSLRGHNFKLCRVIYLTIKTKSMICINSSVITVTLITNILVLSEWVFIKM